MSKKSTLRTKQCWTGYTRANDYVDNVGDDDGMSAIPKTLKEFILIKIKTSFKTPNNDTKETANENAPNERNGNERLLPIM